MTLIIKYCCYTVILYIYTTHTAMYHGLHMHVILFHIYSTYDIV